MLLFTSPEEVHNWVRSLPHHHLRGFVPTMGALHRGHETLIQNCVADNDVTVLSVFVNPTQFNISSDFDNYPSNHSRDFSIAEHHGVDVVYVPTAATMYPEGFGSYVQPGSTATPMEGKSRPGHFRGVTTVVSKLFNTVQPHNVYLGKKDFQQLAVVRQLVQELNYNIEVIGIDTVREDDGLAMSSRNVRLTDEQRHDAAIIYRALQYCKASARSKSLSASEIIKVFNEQLSHSKMISLEYAVVCHAATLEEQDLLDAHSVLCMAAWYDQVRLIDNIELAN